jgi:hypothetical protein
MPIWLRKFTFSTIQDYNKKEKKQLEDAQNQNKGKQTAISPDGKINPAFFARPTKSKYK